jgi:hypothetical protein
MREPAVTCNVSIRQALIVPTRRVLGMARVPSLPPVREPTLRDENREIHVAELIGLTTREGSEQRESLERRIAAGNVRLCGNNTGRDTAR